MIDFQYNVETLSNGIRFVSSFIPNARWNYLGAFVPGGPFYESSSEAGISHFLEHLHSTTSPKWPTQEKFQEVLAENQIHEEIYTYDSEIRFGVCAKHSNFIQAAEILQQMILTREYFPELVESERNVLLDELENVDYGSWNHHNDLFEEPDPSPADHETIRSINRITIEDIKKKGRLLFHPRNFIIIIAGNIEQRDILNIRDIFDAIPEHEHKPLPEVKLTKKQLPIFQIVPHNNATDRYIQHLFFVFSRPKTPVEFAVLFFLGNWFSDTNGKLYFDLRYENTNIYHTHAAFLTYNQFHIAEFQARLKQKDIVPYLKRTCEEFNNLSSGNIPHEWFERGKKKTIIRLDDLNSDRGNLIRFLVRSLTLDQPWSFYDAINAVENLTIDDVAKVSSSLFTQQNLFYREEQFLGLFGRFFSRRTTEHQDLLRSMIPETNGHRTCP